MLSPVTHRQFARLLERFPEAILEELPSGAALVSVPNVALPRGWTPNATTLRFIVPAGYPGPTPDCFWSDADLRVNGGTMPQASNHQQIPETNRSGHWFSWHVTEAARNWHPNRDDLLTYFKLVLERFKKVQ